MADEKVKETVVVPVTRKEWGTDYEDAFTRVVDSMSKRLPLTSEFITVSNEIAVLLVRSERLVAQALIWERKWNSNRDIADFLSCHTEALHKLTRLERIAQDQSSLADIRQHIVKDIELMTESLEYGTTAGPFPCGWHDWWCRISCCFPFSQCLCIPKVK